MANKLLETLKEMVEKERKIKYFKRLLRIKSKITAKGTTKKENITISVAKNDEEYKFVVLKSHKERFALAEKLQVGESVSIWGIPKFRMTICTKLKILDNPIDKEKQTNIQDFI